jgi:hypothetical protein
MRHRRRFDIYAMDEAAMLLLAAIAFGGWAAIVRMYPPF